MAASSVHPDGAEPCRRGDGVWPGRVPFGSGHRILFGVVCIRFPLRSSGVAMPVFEYRALGGDGTRVRGMITAESPRDARERLRRNDIHVTDIRPFDPLGRRSSLWQVPSVLRGSRLRHLAVATRQLSTMLETGLPLAEALTVLVEQVTDRRLSRVFQAVQEKVTHGETFADALADHPWAFDSLYVGMVRSGEAGGRLAEVLARLGESCQKQHRMESRLVSIMTYPILMLILGAGVVTFLLGFVVPRIAAVLEENQTPLPLSTSILVGLGNVVRDWWGLLLAGGVVAVFGLRALGKTELGSWCIDSLKLGVPVAGQLFLKQAAARFAHTLSALLSSGLPVLDALRIVQGVVGNRVLARSIERASESVTAGRDLSQALREAGGFPPILASIVATGEQSGRLDVALEKLAEEFEEEVEIVSQRLMTLLEPLLLLGVAGVVAFIVVSIVQPILELSSF